MSDLEQRLRERRVTFPDALGGGQREDPICIEAADRLRQYREEREVMANCPRINEAIQTAFEKGEIVLSGDGFLTALKETTDVD